MNAYICSLGDKRRIMHRLVIIPMSLRLREYARNASRIRRVVRLQRIPGILVDAHSVVAVGGGALVDVMRGERGFAQLVRPYFDDEGGEGPVDDGDAGADYAQVGLDDGPFYYDGRSVCGG